MTKTGNTKHSADTVCCNLIGCWWENVCIISNSISALKINIWKRYDNWYTLINTVFSCEI